MSGLFYFVVNYYEFPYSQHLGTSLVSMFRTSPTLQVNPLVMEDFKARSGGHWLPIAETFNKGSITALAYGTDKSNIKFNVDPQRSYNWD